MCQWATGCCSTHSGGTTGRLVVTCGWRPHTHSSLARRERVSKGSRDVWAVDALLQGNQAPAWWVDAWLHHAQSWVIHQGPAINGSPAECSDYRNGGLADSRTKLEGYVYVPRWPKPKRCSRCSHVWSQCGRWRGRDDDSQRQCGRSYLLGSMARTTLGMEPNRRMECDAQCWRRRDPSWNPWHQRAWATWSPRDHTRLCAGMVPLRRLRSWHHGKECLAGWTAWRFSVRAVEDVLRKHWTDSDLRRRDAEKGRQFGNVLQEDQDEETAAWVGDWDEGALEAEGFSAEEISYLAGEHEKALQAYQVLQGAKRTLREARSKQHAVKMARQFYQVKSSSYGGKSDSGMWKQMRSKDGTIKCFRCGGPHKVAECKEPPRQQTAAKGQSNVVEEAPFVFLAETAQAFANHTPEAEKMSCLSTREVMEQGKAIIDGGATRTIGSVEALARVVDLNQQLRGISGIKEVDLSDRPVFGFGNSSKDQCVSTASLEVPLAGNMSTLKIHALDKGSAPVLMSVHSLRKLGAIIDFENDLAVFRAVDPRKVIALECTAAGHQVMPLSSDVMQAAKELKAPVPSLADLE